MLFIKFLTQKESIQQGIDALKLTKRKFFFPAFEVCMEAVFAGVSENIRLSHCRDNKFQEFKFDEKGKIHLISNSKLCLTVAQGQSKKGGGGSTVHLMRSLTLELCSDSLNHFQIWDVRKIK